MKHSPFQSIYRENFEVVEQRQGNLTFYPHNDQLPILARALNFEFYGGLPPKLARVDHRADGFHKIALKTAALMFGGYINGGRADQLRLFYYLTPDLVAKITLVQQITEHTRRGLHHRFRWYGTHEFFPDIYLSGKQLIFSDHVLQRFRARVPECVSDDMSTFLMLFFGTPIISMSVGPSRAFILEYMDSILAFTYEETASEYIVTTCLTIHEINTLIVELPPVAHNLHYGPAFTPPRLRHWFPTKYMHKLHECWKRKVPFAPPLPKPPRPFSWAEMGAWLKGNMLRHGHGPGSQLYFMDHIHGPLTAETLPNVPEPIFDERKFYQEVVPDFPWPDDPAPAPPSAPTPPRP